MVLFNSKQITISLIFNIFLSSYAKACDQPVTYVLIGKPAPCTGYLFDPIKEKELRIMNEDYKYLKQETELKDKQINKLKEIVNNSDDIIKKEQERSELWRKKAEESSQKYIESEQGRGERDWLFLLGGIITTVAAGYAIHAAGK